MNATASPPLVSIITITKNAEETISDCLSSIASQTYEHIEHIVIDSVSTDKTLKIIQQHSNPKLTVISERDNGIYEALNKGLRIAQGELIGILHADDFFASERTLETIVEHYKIHKPDIIYGDLIYVSRTDKNRIIRDWKAGEFTPDKLKYGWMPPHPTMFVTNNIFKRCGEYNEHYTIAGDYEYILRLFSRQDVTVLYIPETLVRMRTGGVSNYSLKNLVRKYMEDFKALRASNLNSVVTLLFKNLRKINQLNLLPGKR